MISGIYFLGNIILAANPRLLIFVEGVDRFGEREGFEDHGNWGGVLTGAKKKPINLSNNEKLVYSPHAYGPEVIAKIIISLIKS